VQQSERYYSNTRSYAASVISTRAIIVKSELRGMVILEAGTRVLFGTIMPLVSRTVLLHKTK
jgi:hypothetical protein